MNSLALAAWLEITGSILLLVGSVMTLWRLLASAKTGTQKLIAFVGALWRSPRSRVAASLSDLNEEDWSRVLQGVSILALGYLLSLTGQVWTTFLEQTR